MKNDWTAALPATRNTGDAPPGGPAADVNALRAALGEVRVFVPDGIADLAGLQTALSALSARVSALELAGGVTAVPGAPTIGAATAGTAGSGQATVSFSPPSSNGGSPIIDYTVTSSPGGLSATGTSSPITVTGLTGGTAYTFTVKARNAAGSSTASAASNSVTPAAGTSSAINFSATAGQGQVTAQWSTTRTDITGWNVGRNGTDTDGSGPWATDLAANITTLTFTKLSPGASYTFTLIPKTAAGNLTGQTATATPTSPPTPAAGKTMVGWSSTNIPGPNQDVYGQWMARSNWTNLNNGDYLDFTPLGSYVSSHPNGAIDIGVPLIPFDSGRPYLTELNEAIAGSHDANYTALGAKLATIGPKTVFARVWWEFNMFNPPATQFVQAWQRAVPLLRSGFASAAKPGQTLKIVWCYLTANNNPVPFWPGPLHVDIIGSDIYGIVYGSSNPTQAAMLSHVSNCLSELTSFCATYNKPAALGEWANVIPKSGTALDSRGLGDCPAYIDQIFDWINTQNTTAQVVSHVVYFNDPGGGVGATINQQPNSLARFQARAAALQA